MPATRAPQHALLPELMPELMRFDDGQRVNSPGDWARRRLELRQAALRWVYGDLPATPRNLSAVLLHEARAHVSPGARLHTYRVVADGQSAFILRLLLPDGGPGPFATLLYGDACWDYASDAVKAAVLARGYALAEFDRVEIMSDPAPPSGPEATAAPVSTCPALQAYTGAAIAAWAWGFHRGVDALLQMPQIDASRIAIVGHSRGGKAALLAGATDERIALTSANSAGAGGAGSFKRLGPGAETLGDIAQAFAHWFSPALQHFKGREEALAFDQHFLKALIAPRYLLTTEALHDSWSNPSGSWHTHQAARQVYRWLGAEDRLAISFRAGGHAHLPADWQTLLAHMDACFCGLALPAPTELTAPTF